MTSCVDSRRGRRLSSQAVRPVDSAGARSTDSCGGAAGTSRNPQSPRPGRTAARDLYTFAARTIDFAAMEAARARDKVHRLTVMECDLLRYLMAKAGQPVSRPAILREVWGLRRMSIPGRSTTSSSDCGGMSRIVPPAPKFLQTVRGVGYRFVPEP